MSLFNDDIKKEAILAKFLDQQYQKNNLKINRISDKESQFKGIDLIIEGKEDIKYKVDEKAQLHYLNKNLPTFALEISYFKDSILKQGWLFDPSKETELYAFVFSIHLVNNETEMKDENDVESCEVIFVNRSKLINKLAELELSFDKCNSISNEIRSNGSLSKLEHLPSGFNFQISDHLSEKPINLIVKKRFLKSIGKSFLFKRS